MVHLRDYDRISFLHHRVLLITQMLYHGESSMSTFRTGLRWSFVSAMLALLSTAPISAQRSDGKAAERVTPPSGAEIAAAARAAALDVANATTATLSGKSFRFTPARGNASGNEAFAGVLENGAPGVRTGLPTGRYNVYVARVNGQWKAFAESGGQIVRETLDVTVSPGTPGAKPYFIEKDGPGDLDVYAAGPCAQGEVALRWCAGVLILVPAPTLIVVCW